MTCVISVQRINPPLVLVCYYLDYSLFIMSRSHSSGHSRSDRSRRASNISVTEASFQGLHLGETAGSPLLSAPLSAYQGSTEQYRRRSPGRGDPIASYLQAGYDPSTLNRASPSRGFAESQPVYYTLGTANADIPAYQFDPTPTALVSEQGPSPLGAYGGVDMRYMQSSPPNTSNINKDKVPTAMRSRPC